MKKFESQWNSKYIHSINLSSFQMNKYGKGAYNTCCLRNSVAERAESSPTKY